MKLKISWIYLLFGLLCLTAGQAHAAIVYSETPNLTTGTLSDVDRPFYLANDFMLGSDTTVTGVEWRGMYFSSATPQAVDAFTINFYADNGGSVGAFLAGFDVGNDVNRALAGINFNAQIPFYGYQSDLGSGIDLLANTTYWISIFNDTTA